MQREKNDGAGRGHDSSSDNRADDRIRELEAENRRLREELGGEIERLRLIVDSLPGPVAHIDGAHRYTLVNRVYSDLFADGREELKGRGMLEILGEERYGELAPHLERAFAGHDIDIESRLEVPGQGRRILRSSIRPHRVDDGGIGGVLIQSTDVTDQRKVVTALKETELRLHRIADSGIIGIGFWEEGGRIVDGNETLLRMLGRSREDLSSGQVTIGMITAPEYHAADEQASKQMLSGGFALPYEKDLIRPDGSRLPVLFGMGLYEGHHDRGAFFVHDISDKRQVETALRRSESTLRRLSSSGIIGIIMATLDGTITDANDLFLSMIGRSREELEAGRLHSSQFTLPGTLEQQQAVIDEIVSTGRSAPFEIEVVHSDGSRIPVMTGTALLDTGEGEVICYVLDLSERERTQRALRESEERYRAWVENSTEAIWRCELEIPIPVDLAVDEQLDRFYRDGYLAECNLAMARMYGLADPLQIVGTRLSDLLVRSDPANEAYLRRFVLSGYRLVDAESIELDSEGAQKNFLNNLTGIVENGMLLRAWGTQRDITERKRAERELELARETAEAASRAKDRFLATLSHELRTPLTPVVAAIDLLRSEDNLPPAIASALDIIARNVDLEARLIDDLLDLTRITNDKLELRTETVDLPSLLERVVEICQGDLAQKRLQLDLALDVGTLPIEGDPGRLQQVFWNLLKNAIKFTPEQGRIWIRCQALNERVKVEIGDTGIGIEPEVLPRIFDPFEQGAAGITRRFGGLGLGLAISRTIVAMHGGSLTAASPGRDQGSVFTVTLVRSARELRR